MKVYAVVEIMTNPHGETMGWSHIYKLFTTEASAKEYKKELVRKYTSGPERRPVLGHFNVNTMNVEEI